MDWKWFFFSFKGRLNRKPYLLFMLPVFVLALLLSYVTYQNRESGLPGYIEIFQFIILWPFLAVQVKRWHDFNRFGFWVLVNLLPLVGPIYALLATSFYEGSQGENLFGEDPLTRLQGTALKNMDKKNETKWFLLTFFSSVGGGIALGFAGSLLAAKLYAGGLETLGAMFLGWSIGFWMGATLGIGVMLSEAKFPGAWLTAGCFAVFLPIGSVILSVIIRTDSPGFLFTMILVHFLSAALAFCVGRSRAFANC